MLLNSVMEKTLESPLENKEIKPVNSKGNQFWKFIGSTDAEAEVPMLCPPDSKSWVIRKDLDAGKDWRQEEKGMTEDEMVGWHHWFNGHEFEQALGDGEGQGSLVCCSPWGRKDWTWLSEWRTIYTMEYYPAIKRNKIVPFAKTWMDLEIVIQSKVNQKKKTKYHIISLILESRKMVQMNLFAKQK